MPEAKKVLPSPQGGESENDFISRCMSDDRMQDEFPKKKQRLAVCYNQYRGSVIRSNLNEIESGISSADRSQ